MVLPDDSAAAGWLLEPLDWPDAGSKPALGMAAGSAADGPNGSLSLLIPGRRRRRLIDLRSAAAVGIPDCPGSVRKT